MTAVHHAVAASLLLFWSVSACGTTATDTYVIANDPGQVTPLSGTDLGIVTLTEEAATRLGISTEQVKRSGAHLVVPSEAVLVDPDGVWWVFTSPAPHRYVRVEIEVLREQEGVVYLTSGPDPGTDVVTVGVAQLYGVEKSVGH